MSTMVGMTAGVSCSEVGITYQDCSSQMGESVKSYMRLRQPEIRNAIFDNFAKGAKRSSIGIERSKSPWNVDLKRRRNSRQVTSAS